MSDLSKIRYEFYSLKRAVEDELRQLLRLNLNENVDSPNNQKNINTLITCLESDCDSVKSLPSKTAPAKVVPKGPSGTGAVPKGSGLSCALCRSNGETRVFVTSHVLRGEDGKVSCPVLRNYVCPICGVSGDYAHTVRYCPKNKDQLVSQEVLKHLRNSTGHNFVYKKKYC